VEIREPFPAQTPFPKLNSWLDSLFALGQTFIERASKKVSCKFAQLIDRPCKLCYIESVIVRSD